RWRSVQVDGREWMRPDLSLRAFSRAAERRGATFRAVGASDGPAPPERESRWRLWRSNPGLVRAEFDAGGQIVTAVVRDETWWSWTSTGPVRTNGGQPGSSVGQGPGQALLRPAAV